MVNHSLPQHIFNPVNKTLDLKKINENSDIFKLF